MYATTNVSSGQPQTPQMRAVWCRGCRRRLVNDARTLPMPADLFGRIGVTDATARWFCQRCPATLRCPKRRPPLFAMKSGFCSNKRSSTVCMYMYSPRLPFWSPKRRPILRLRFQCLLHRLRPTRAAPLAVTLAVAERVTCTANVNAPLTTTRGIAAGLAHKSCSDGRPYMGHFQRNLGAVHRPPRSPCVLPTGGGGLPSQGVCWGGRRGAFQAEARSSPRRSSLAAPCPLPLLPRRPIALPNPPPLLFTLDAVSAAQSGLYWRRG